MDRAGTSPNPGSDEAVLQGCTCPISDNARGRGYMGIPGQFWMTGGCPLHGFKKEAPDGEV